MRAVVARSTFGSENVETPGVGPLFDDSIAIPCRKSARCRGAKHVWKSNVPKTEGFEPLFDVLDVVLLTDKWI